MLLDKIEIDSPFKEVNEILEPRILNECHKFLCLKKKVHYFFLTDEELLNVNIETLSHNTYTDIITFDYSDDDDIESSEILISWDRIKENAMLHNQTITQELYRVCFHGLLHLSGVNDKTEEEQTNMTIKENQLINLFCST